jgi:hypothetical protein
MTPNAQTISPRKLKAIRKMATHGIYAGERENAAALLEKLSGRVAEPNERKRPLLVYPGMSRYLGEVLNMVRNEMNGHWEDSNQLLARSEKICGRKISKSSFKNYLYNFCHLYFHKKKSGKKNGFLYQAIHAEVTL